MNLSIVPGAVAALEEALLGLTGSSSAGFAALEASAKSMVLASYAEVLSRALEARNRGLLSSCPVGSRVHSGRTCALVTPLRSGGPGACAEAMLDLVDDDAAAEGPARRLLPASARSGDQRGPSMGTMEGKQQHMYKSRMATFPCARPSAGADAMARVRSWLCSGFALPARTREASRSLRRPQEREACEVRLFSARDPRTIRGEGAGASRHR